MKLFISYARIDKPYCVQVVDTLDVHNIWYDQRLYAGQQWWEEILRRLDWCEGFVFLLSPESVNSEYCMKELDIALRLNRAVIPVLIHADTKIPPQLTNIQYVDAVNGLNIDNVRVLLNSIYLAEQGQHETQNTELLSVGHIDDENRDVPIVKSAKIVGMAASALESAQYDRAVFLLKQAKENGYQSRFINIDLLLAEAERALEKQSLMREAEREYDQIYQLIQVREAFSVAVNAFSEFQKVFPNYDPRKIAEHIERVTPTAPVVVKEKTAKDWEILPMLKWLPISAGVVRMNVPAYDQELVEVDDFWMAQFPVTNEQYNLFINDPDGYSSSTWWQYSDYALAWFNDKTNSGSLQPQFLGYNHPRETINWYEAIAFCNWLSHQIDAPVTLPTLAQWQRAAVGDRDTAYPWGNDFIEDCANTRENQLRMTTPVDRFPNGQSPFGVFDLAGNIWEWTLDKAEDPNTQDADYKRGVIGGSHVSPRERAQASFSYFLTPESRYGTIGFRPIILPPSAHRPPHLQY